MILVTGATGTIGGEVVRLLAERGEPVRAMTRSPSTARLPAGVEVVAGDFEEPASLASAADGVSALFLVSAPGASLPVHDLAMIQAARVAGVGAVVKLSAIGTTEDEHARVGQWHRPGELAARTSGLVWTILRPSSFASNTLSWAEAIRAGQPVPNMSGAGAQGVVDPRDVAEVAVAALTAPEDGRTYTVTGPELLSVPDQAAVLAAVLGRPVTTVDVPLDTVRAHMLAAGRDAAFVAMATDGAAFVRDGGNAVLTGDVQRLLGRPPRTFRAWAGDHRAAFADDCAQKGQL